MKTLLKILGVFAGLLILAVIVIALLTPRMDRWGATNEEVAMTFPGDELVPNPASYVNRAVSVAAAPGDIYPWIVQLDARKGGWYSYTWLESLIGCSMVNADRIHPEWQDLQVGDTVNMCPDEPAPPPYVVAQIHPDLAIVLGHQEDGEWVDLYQFVILPQTDGSSRLILRTRTQMTGGFWSIFHPAFFIMERGLLLGIKERAEQLAQSGSAAPVAAVATTPEVFIPLDPAPTPFASDLPPTCQVTDLNVYIDRAAGYCFAYPTQFNLGEQPSDKPMVIGPALEVGANPLRVTLEIDSRPVPADSSLPALVEAYLSSIQSSPKPINSQMITLGSEPAQVLEPIPGLLSAREVLVLHGSRLFSLRFHPAELEIARTDLTNLYQTVSGSFAFLDGQQNQAAGWQNIGWYEFGQNITLTYPADLAPWVSAQTMTAVPASDQILYSESHPQYAQIRFTGYQGGRPYQLPILPPENSVAQVMIFQTADFSGYGDDFPNGFNLQLQALQQLLAAGVDPEYCAQSYAGQVAPLPFLPWVNSEQVFCSHLQEIQFSGGKGIRYLTFFSQGANPVLEGQAFYTFQGLTDDGQFYVSAFFPVWTGIFPTEPPPCPQCGQPDYDPYEALNDLLIEQLAGLNALPETEFSPPIDALDAVISSLQIRQ